MIQRRGDFGEPRENFTRSWEEYKMGFGDLNTCAEEESDFLSESSISESDFQVILKDDFMNLM